MFDFLIRPTCRIYGNLKLFSVWILRLYFVEKIPALATRKRVNKAIHPQFPIKCPREVKLFLPMVFQMIPPVRVKTLAWNILFAGKFILLIPSITVSHFAATHMCILKSFTLYSNSLLWGVCPNVNRYFDWSIWTGGFQPILYRDPL